MVQRIWQRAKETANSGIVDASQRRSINYGRKRISLEPHQVVDIPLKRRTNLRSMAIVLDMSLTTLFRWNK